MVLAGLECHHAFDFDLHVTRQGAHGYCGACREGRGEVAFHDFVYFGEALHVSEEDVEFDDVAEVATGCLANRKQVGEDALDLCRKIVFDFHGFGVERDLSGEEDEVAGAHGL